MNWLDIGLLILAFLIGAVVVITLIRHEDD